jgi:hypothetical protein
MVRALMNRDRTTLVPAWRQRRYPTRTIHLVDVENLAGSARPEAAGLRWLRDRYITLVGPGPWIMSSSPPATSP